MRVKFGVCLPNFGKNSSRESITKIAKAAEELGYDSIWVTDHILMPRNLSYPYGRIYEPLITLSYVAAITQRVKLGTSIIVLPMRNAVITAKELATLDNLSGGRLIAGFAVGWAEEEFRNLGAPFKGRGELFSEQLKLLKTLWSSRSPTFVGKYHKIESAVFDPRPIQPDGPPIWLGGHSRAAVRRALSLADGWHFSGIPLDEFHDRIRLVQSSNREGFVVSGRFSVDLSGKSPRETVAPTGMRRVMLSGRPQQVIEQLTPYAEAGATYFVLNFGDKQTDKIIEDMKIFTREVEPSFS